MCLELFLKSWFGSSADLVKNIGVKIILRMSGDLFEASCFEKKAGNAILLQFLGVYGTK